jgi:hypothetical protein
LFDEKTSYFEEGYFTIVRDTSLRQAEIKSRKKLLQISKNNQQDATL